MHDALRWIQAIHPQSRRGARSNATLLITASRRTANANGDTEAGALMFGSLYFILISTNCTVKLATLELMCVCARVCVCARACECVWRDHFNCFLIPAESTLNTYCLINKHCIKVCFYLWKQNGLYIYKHVIICSIFTSRWIFFFICTTVCFKINEKKPSIVDFFFFSCCTEIVSNRDPRTEVRTEPWHLCTVPPLIDSLWNSEPWHARAHFIQDYSVCQSSGVI